MAQKKITQRWLTGSLGVILVILVIVEIAVWAVVRTFYYSSAQQTLLSQANTVNTLLAKYAEDPSIDYQREVRNLVENFELRDRMELMAVDAYGNVTSTSSGFAVNEKIEMPDFEAALASPDRMGSFQGELGGERIIAISSIAPVNDESLVAVRAGRFPDQGGRTDLYRCHNGSAGRDRHHLLYAAFRFLLYQFDCDSGRRDRKDRPQNCPWKFQHPAGKEE